MEAVVMSSFFSRMMSVASDSAMIAMTKRARELKAQGKDVIALSSGEPAFDTPENVRRVAQAAVARGDEENHKTVDESKNALAIP